MCKRQFLLLSTAALNLIKQETLYKSASDGVDLTVSHPILNWETSCLYLKKLTTKCNYPWSVWDIPIASMKTQVREITEKHSTDLMNSNFLLRRRRRRKGQQLALPSKGGCWGGKEFHGDKSDTMTLSPIPESLSVHDQPHKLLGISKSPVWAKLSQRQLRGDAFPHFLPAFISFNSSDPTHLLHGLKQGSLMRIK